MTSFGVDTSCTNALRPGQRVSGVRLVAEAAYRRLTTPRGMLRGGEDEANYGFDLLETIGSVTTKSQAASIGGRIRNELLKDERIETVNVEVVVMTNGPSSMLDVTIEAVTREGPFTLVLAVGELSVDLLDIVTEA